MIADKSYEAMLYFAVRKRGKPNQNNQNLQRLCHHTCIFCSRFSVAFSTSSSACRFVFFWPFTIFLFLSSVFLEVTIGLLDLQAKKIRTSSKHL
jgi:hypothetical protein